MRPLPLSLSLSLPLDLKPEGLFNADETFLSAAKSGDLVPARVTDVHGDSPYLKHIRKSTAGSLLSFVNAVGDSFMLVYILKSKSMHTKAGNRKQRVVILPASKASRKGAVRLSATCHNCLQLTLSRLEQHAVPTKLFSSTTL